MYLDGKTILVTGAGGGIGWGICLECAREGARVIVTDINEASGKEVLAELMKISIGHEFLGLDVRNIEDGKALIEKIYTDGKQIDVLINNAGVNTRNRFLDMTEEAWDKVYETNIRGHVFLAQSVAKKMIENKTKGVILFTSSIHQEVIQGRPHYSSSKAALEMLIKEMAAELAEFGIRVNGVAPGGIYIDKKVEDPQLANDEPRVLLGGMNGIPRDVGRVMVMLASDYWSRQITGRIISVDGGQYLDPNVLG
jgi:NAD(P)-dependent dehydrogenase (short-subunit alcohol dehydrogenase family)